MREELKRRITEKVKSRRSQLYYEIVRLVKEYNIPTGDGLANEFTVFSQITKIAERGIDQEVTKEVDAALKKIVDRLERDILCDTTDGNQK
jgi:hypothetical protein